MVDIRDLNTIDQGFILAILATVLQDIRGSGALNLPSAENNT
jgi:hypothetical protein